MRRTVRTRLCIVACAIVICITIYFSVTAWAVNLGRYVVDRRSQKFRTTVEFRELGAQAGSPDIVTGQFIPGVRPAAKGNDVAGQLAIDALSPTVKNAISDAGPLLPLSQTAGNAIDVSGPLLPELKTEGTVTRFEMSAMGGDDRNYVIWDTIQGIHGQHFKPPTGEECRSRLPGCIILGDFKAGTRELIDFMAMHPNVVIKRDPIYEISFFSNDHKYNLGLDWYRSAMPCSYSNQMTVEKSPPYFQSALAPQRIHKMNPDIKLIVLLREPVSATFSHCSYWNINHTCDLSRIFADFPNNTQVRTDIYVKYRLYDEALSRYYAVFNRSQLLVINHKNLIRNPYLVLKRVENFLELQPRIKAEHFALNEGKGFFCVTPGNTTTATCFNEKRGRSAHSTESNNTIAKLKEFFRPHNERLFQLLGYTIDWE